jgi:hypothetical protein
MCDLWGWYVLGAHVDVENVELFSICVVLHDSDAYCILC